MRCKATDAQFLPRFPRQCFLYTPCESRKLIAVMVKTFLVVDMPSNGSVPFPWLNILPYWSLLKKEVSVAVEDMKMHYWMQHLPSSVSLSTCYLS